MSTAARKVRKRSGERFVRPVKVGTPAVKRIENQQRSFYVQGSFVFKRFGLSSGAARRLEARGVVTEVPILDAPKLSRAEHAQVRRFGLDKPEADD